jgi:hypothetical protein
MTSIVSEIGRTVEVGTPRGESLCRNVLMWATETIECASQVDNVERLSLFRAHFHCICKDFSCLSVIVDDDLGLHLAFP